MRSLFLTLLLFISTNSFAQDEIKYKTAFENVEQNCDSLMKVELCYLARFQNIINRKFTDELIKNIKLSKHIDDNIYLEIEVDTSGHFIINKIETKSSEIKVALLDLMKVLPKIKSVENKIIMEAIFDFKLKEVTFDDFNNTDEKRIYSNLITPKFSECKLLSNEIESKECFNIKMNKHIIENFNYPKKAINKNITGKTFGNFIVEKDGSIENFIVYGANPILLKENLRILKLLPKFIPGTYNNKEIRVPYAQPITFKLK